MTNKHTERFPTSLVIRETQIKTQRDTTSPPPGQLQSKRQRIVRVGDDVGKLEPSQTTSENVKLYSSFGKQL